MAKQCQAQIYNNLISFGQFCQSSRPKGFGTKHFAQVVMSALPDAPADHEAAIGGIIAGSELTQEAHFHVSRFWNCNFVQVSYLHMQRQRQVLFGHMYACSSSTCDGIVRATHLKALHNYTCMISIYLETLKNSHGHLIARRELAFSEDSFWWNRCSPFKSKNFKKPLHSYDLCRLCKRPCLFFRFKNSAGSNLSFNASRRGVGFHVPPDTLGNRIGYTFRVGC